MMGRTYRFCPLCGSPLESRMLETEDRVRDVCTACDFVHYHNPTPAAGIIVVEDGRVLLVKRKFDPRKEMWTLPAGFVEANEDVATCVIREAKEETNLDVDIDRLFGVYSAFDDPRAAVVLILYMGRRVGGTLRCGDDASDARYFPLNDLPENIAFRAHKIALAEIKEQHERGLL